MLNGADAADLGIVRIFVPWPDGRTDVVSGILISPWWVVTVGQAVDAAARRITSDDWFVDASRIAALRAFAPDPASNSPAPVLALPAFDYAATPYKISSAATPYPGNVVALHLSRRFAPAGMAFPNISWLFNMVVDTPLSRYGYGPVFNDQVMQFRSTDMGLASNPYDGWRARILAGFPEPGNAGAPVRNNDGAIVGIQLGFITEDQKTLLYQPFGPGDQGMPSLDGYFVLPLALPTDVVWAGGGTLTWSNYIIEHPDRDWSGFGGGVAGYRVFYKYASGDDSWQRANAKDVMGLTTDLAVLDLLPSDTSVWKFTVLPLAWDASHNKTLVLGAKSLTEQYPPDGDRGGCTAWGTYTYAFPYALAARGAKHGEVALSWAPTEYIEGHPDIAAYQIFAKLASDGDSWSSAVTAWADPGAVGIILSPLDSTEWVFTILPVVDDTIIGAGPDGLPLPGSQSNISVGYAPPQVAGQYPNPAAQVFVPLFGAGSISARFVNSDAGTTYQWEYSATADGVYAEDRDWSHTNGGTGSTLWFGGLAANGRVNPADAGWYRLKATNGLGTGYSEPVHVVIEGTRAPILIDQSPAAGQEISRFPTLPPGFGNPLINQVAVVRFSSMQRGYSPIYEWQSSPLRYGTYTRIDNAPSEARFNVWDLPAQGPLWVRCQATKYGGYAYSEPFLATPVAQSQGPTPAVQSSQHPGPFAEVIVPLERNEQNSFLYPGYLTGYAATDLIPLPGALWNRSDTLTGGFSADGQWTSFVQMDGSLLGFLGNGYPGIAGAYAFYVNDGNGHLPPMHVAAVDGDGQPVELFRSAASARGRAGRIGTAEVTWAFSNMYGISGGYLFGTEQSNAVARSAGGVVFTSLGIPSDPARTEQSGRYELYAQNAYGLCKVALDVVIDAEGITNWGASDMTSSGLTGIGAAGTLVFSASNGVNTPSSIRATGTFVRVITLPRGLEVDTSKSFTWDPWDGGGGEPLATVDENGTIVTWGGLSYWGKIDTTEKNSTITLGLVIPDNEQDNWTGIYDYSRAKPISIPVTITSENAWNRSISIQWSVSPGTLSTSPEQVLWYDLSAAPELISQAPEGEDKVMVTTGSVGALAITAHFSTDSVGDGYQGEFGNPGKYQRASGYADRYQWEFASAAEGPWTSSNGLWSNKVGRNTRVLTFGMDRAAVSAFDTGWYRLVVTSWADEVGYSRPIRVSTDTSGWERDPKFLSQVPAGGQSLDVDLGSVGDASISAFPSAAGAGTSLRWEWSPSGLPDSFTAARDWSRTAGRFSTTLTFGVPGDNGGVTVADLGWYRLAWDTQTGAGTLYSDPVLCGVLAPTGPTVPTVVFPKPGVDYKGGSGPGWWQQGMGIPVVGAGVTGASVTVMVDGVEWKANIPVKDGMWNAGFWNQPGRHGMVVTQSYGTLTSAPVTLSFNYDNAPAGELASPTIVRPVPDEFFAAATGRIYGRDVVAGSRVTLTLNGDYWQDASIDPLMPDGGGSTLWEWIANDWSQPGIWVLGVTQTVDGKSSPPAYVAFSIED